MSKEKTKGNEVLEEALRESCESYPDRYPRYEGDIDLGEDYARYKKRLFRRANAPTCQYIGSASRRVSVLAASFILFFACSMVAVWLSVILYDHTEMPPDHPTSGPQTTETAPIQTGASTETKTGTNTGTNTGTTVESLNTETSGTHSVKPPAVMEVPDEQSAVHCVTEANGDGLQIEITVYGYQSKELKKEFYVKNNEYFVVKVKLRNDSVLPVYQWLPTACRDAELPHNHEVSASLFCGSYQLHSSVSGLPCSGARQKWTVQPGETYEFYLKLAAGELCYDGNHDLPGDGKNGWPGIKLYGPELYGNGICTFAGKISFAYTTDEERKHNDLSLSVPLTVDVLYVSSVPNA